jgi:hypothetical protein
MRRYIGLAAGVGLVVAALSASGALPAAAQGPFKPVLSLIINDATQPVPVTGTINGTVNATLTAPLTLAPGQTVGLVGGSTVNIGNTSDNPVLVRELTSARVPVSVFNFCQFTGQECYKDLYTVPAGSHLAIEHVSMSGDLFNPQEFGDMRLMSGILGANTHFGAPPYELFVPTVISTAGILRVRDTRQTLMFFSAGEIVRLYATRSEDGFAGNVSVTFSGYLITN